MSSPICPSPLVAPSAKTPFSYLAENESVALKREQILDAVWGQDYDGTFRTVDTVIKQIRNKMGKKCPYIRSIYGVGYIFEVNDD